MEEAVEMFEPRLRNVRITLNPVAKGSRTLRFGMEGMLMLDPAPEQVRFDTLLELTSGDIEVRGDGGA
jgi:predicted component of type VI protein secretion system